MLIIRLSRVGKKKYPTYRIVIQEKSRDPWGKALEILGNYNPHTKEFACKEDRIKYWLSVGAQMSATVNNLLIRKGVIHGEKKKAAKLNKKKAQAEKDKAAEETKDKEENKPAEGSKEDKQEDKSEVKPENVKEDKKEEKSAEKEKKEDVKKDDPA